MTTRTIEEKKAVAHLASTEDQQAAPPRRRPIGYCIVNSSASTDTAILYFYPLGVCSEFILGLAPALSNISAKTIAVDRPGCAETSWNEDPQEKADAVMRRIHTHATDVLQVLQEEGIRHVYVLCACIGHAYGIEVCKRLIMEQTKEGPQLEAITLVAPFVSTMCPTAWFVAHALAISCRRLYSMPPTASNPSLLPMSLRPKMVRKIMSDQAEGKDFGWTERDLEEACESALSMNQKTAKCGGIEVEVGVSKVWQEHVCDEFAAANGARVAAPLFQLQFTLAYRTSYLLASLLIGSKSGVIRIAKLWWNIRFTSTKS